MVKVSDDLTVRLFALDTFSGRFLGPAKSFYTQANNGAFPVVPINLALSPDGTLVYTLPDRLVLKDLYKGWGEEEKTIVGQAGQPIYVGATQADQLVIAEGRILALADNAPGAGALPPGVAVVPNFKWVRIHSLETGQPLTLRYTGADGSHKEIDRILTTGSTDWNVSLHVVGPHLYVQGPKHLFAYNLDKPAETWPGTIQDLAYDIPMGQAALDTPRYIDMFVGQNHVAAFSRPGRSNTPDIADPTQITFMAYSRRPRANADSGAESGTLSYSVPITDKSGIKTDIQACDGGFYYATGDGKVHVLRGAMKN